MSSWQPGSPPINGDTFIRFPDLRFLPSYEYFVFHDEYPHFRLGENSSEFDKVKAWLFKHLGGDVGTQFNTAYNQSHEKFVELATACDAGEKRQGCEWLNTCAIRISVAFLEASPTPDVGASERLGRKGVVDVVYVGPMDLAKFKRAAKVYTIQDKGARRIAIRANELGLWSKKYFVHSLQLNRIKSAQEISNVRGMIAFRLPDKQGKLKGIYEHLDFWAGAKCNYHGEEYFNSGTEADIVVCSHIVRTDTKVGCDTTIHLRLVPDTNLG